MSLDSWLGKLKSAISNVVDSSRPTMVAPEGSLTFPIAGRHEANVSILAFEIASLMSKLLHLWRSLSDSSLLCLRHETIYLPGVRKIVSDDDDFLLAFACADFTDALRSAAESISTIAPRCSDPTLRFFKSLFQDFADSDHDPYRWSMTLKEMNAKIKKMDRYVSSTAALYKEMDELAEAERALRSLCGQNIPARKVAASAEAQQKIAVSLLARSSFTILSRIKQVFGIGPPQRTPAWSSTFLSAAVYPEFTPRKHRGFFESSAGILIPPATTLGAAGLTPLYANLIVLMEKMVRSRTMCADARDELYTVLPASIRILLRARLRKVGWNATRDAGLATEWRAALRMILDWLVPMALATLRWHAERSFERRNTGSPRANVLLLQTLYYANTEKVEAAIAELLVGLNYLCRFEMQHRAKPLESSEIRIA
ncbi:hypothetical protein HPP92_026374 [Vanilla planifolia]|uniref:Uncharacterized protein n=1 Tax=Vanilla planifolia TaxID=51239 RepID=A0A835PH48_VANPL|nr:hypothetical protein HPP92_026374 [Vanilla planifolia]